MYVLAVILGLIRRHRSILEPTDSEDLYTLSDIFGAAAGAALTEAITTEAVGCVVLLGRVDTMNLTQWREGAKMRLLRCHSRFSPRHSRESGNPEGWELCLCYPHPPSFSNFYRES